MMFAGMMLAGLNFRHGVKMRQKVTEYKCASGAQNTWLSEMLC